MEERDRRLKWLTRYWYLLAFGRATMLLVGIAALVWVFILWPGEAIGTFSRSAVIGLALGAAAIWANKRLAATSGKVAIRLDRDAARLERDRVAHKDDGPTDV
jgi:hypothetical protein